MKKIISIFTILLASISILAGGLVPTFAQDLNVDPCKAGGASTSGCNSPILDALGLNKGNGGLSGIQAGIANLARTLIALLAVVSVLFLIWNAYKMISDSGDGKGYKAGLDGVKYAIIGLVIALLAFGIVSIVVSVIGGR
jgi:hypothetical protein